MANAGSDVDAFPSLTLITMLPKVPTAVVVGVPSNAPVPASNVAQAGRPETLKVSGLLSASLAVGTNAYALPAVTEAGGTPEMTGAELPPDAVTVMPNGASCAVLSPLLTAMTMLL